MLSKVWLIQRDCEVEGLVILVYEMIDRENGYLIIFVTCARCSNQIDTNCKSDDKYTM